MTLHTDSAPRAHFRARVADHGGLTRPPCAGSANGTASGTMSGTMSSTTHTTTENG
ncbi:hypothetical protein OG730_31370 [Streptomyces sp. NBC_01298]|uniref:hypothetical protein n=1 Tax=Streptomyces sp. NBC_01298 TaxID=2903817 RepID=UPI002E119140|nr:hypothetical protein OG730_31370 [Streptomyces sp. NBC_01298]